VRALIQRVSFGSVAIDGEVCGEIGDGLVILLGIAHEDSSADIEYLVKKIAGLRIFSDQDAKFNHSLGETGGDALVISQFTLFADTRKGRRPGFTASAPPAIAVPLYEEFLAKISENISGKIACGRFGADMKVTIHNDGPVTIMIDSRDKIPPSSTASS